MTNTYWFWILAALMLLVALALVLPPLLGRGQRAGRTANTPDLNTQQARLTALDEALARGDISADEHATQRARLGDQLLDALMAGNSDQPAVPRKALALTALVAIPAASIALYVWLGADEALQPEPAAHPTTAMGDVQTAASVQEMVDGLAERMRQNPGDAEGWVMLARSYMTLERYQDASDAYAQAHTLVGDEPLLLVDYAEAAAFANNNSMSGLPNRLLNKALEMDPNNHKGMWLAGFAALQHQNTTRALELWNQLLAELPAGSTDAEMVADMIAEAGGTAAAPAPVAETAPSPTPAAGPAVEVSVSLDPALAADLSGDETVFVFARAVQGPPMPLAIQRRSAAELPFTVVLDDSTSMMPAMKLSLFPTVTIGARISRTGDAMARPGDLQGLVSPVQVAERPSVELTITEVVQ